MNIAFLMDTKDKVYYLNAEDTVRQAIEKMRAHQYMTMPVVNANQEFVTIISEGDLLFQYGRRENLYDQEDKLVKNMIPRRTIATANIYSTMDEIISIIVEKNQNFVPVIDDRHKFIGIITRKKVMRYILKEKQMAYQEGVMDTFMEMVKAGMKRIALAHPFKIKEERDEYIHFVSEKCKEYGIHYYLDDTPLITDLFEKHLNYGTYNIIFYKQQQDIQEYINLKEYKYSTDYELIRHEVAYRFGKLLSYSDETIENYISNNHEKE